MTYKTFETTLNPDGRLALPPTDIPNYPVKVMVTILDGLEEATLSEPGDYLEQLSDYEDRLARGEIRWQ